MPGLFDDLVERVAVRACDLNRRNDLPPALRGKTVRAGGFAVSGVSVSDILAGRTSPTPAPEAETKGPVSEKQLKRAEAKLKFAIPEHLRRLYREIGDGGFGPGEGLLPLERLVKTRVRYLLKSPGRKGQLWPENLLPITPADPGHDCLNLVNGEILYWDREEIAFGGGQKAWARCFKHKSADLAAWLEQWLESPSPEQRQKSVMEKAARDERERMMAWWRGRTPAERAAFGLPEIGWEEALLNSLNATRR